MSDSILLSAGSNAHGQLSNNSLHDAHFFSPCSFTGCPPGTLPNNRKLVQVACGANHTIALLQRDTPDGELITELWGCGDGSSGQLGPSYASDESTSIFRQLDLALERNRISEYLPKMVCASWETTYVVLSAQGKPDVLISMGANDFGDLGIGAKRAGKLPAKDFHLVQFDHLEMSLLVVESMAAGQHHVVAKVKTALQDGTPADIVVGWGTSRHGQLGAVGKPFLLSPVIIPGHLGDAVVSAALGLQHTVFLHSSATLSGLGSNRKHQLEGVDIPTHVRGVDCTWNGTYVVTGDELSWTLLSTGNNANGQLGRGDAPDTRVAFPFTSETHRLLDIACGSEHVLASFVVRSSDAVEVWGWGWNEHGNLGIGTTDDVRVPIRIWPRETSMIPQGAITIWAGSGTSWIAIQ
ncbi:regulator of chromosome condensation 1/beta-lactamase-inhibitor protein II [Mycena sp. CBHHK59/15]|nr:regulator of chromosome condensation 1/beta-lactamase-inhibitor protein II [Mycena sp. CBHHK59/15]